MRPTAKSLAEALASLGHDKSEPRQKDEFTTIEASQAAGMSRQRMRELLVVDCNEGKVSRRETTEGGKRVVLWKILPKSGKKSA